MYSLSLRVNGWLYSTRTLRTFRFLKLTATCAIGLTCLLAYMLSYTTLIAQYGYDFVTLASTLYICFGAVVILYLALTSRKNSILPVLFLVFIPTSLLTRDGVTLDIYLVLLWLIHSLEKRHRQRAVQIVSYYSENFSPLYQERYDNRKNSQLSTFAYTILPLISVEDYSLVKEVKSITTDYKKGLGEEMLTRTFKIKGVWGTTSIVDELYVTPKKRWFSFFRRF
ncbi:hypothetical protein [Streptococcus ferus]|uniref:hypothetical protein n=1 Tax=Streptococcus ferus TaxID=1345 RepID=UPI00359F1CCD